MKTNRHPIPEIYALLFVDHESEQFIRDILMYDHGVEEQAIANRLHLTVYYARRLIPGIENKSADCNIDVDVSETRFMVLAPGGENPRPELEPSRRSVGIRLTRRNKARAAIQSLREQLYGLETPEVIGYSRRPTDAHTSAFGARHYQPHIKLLRPGNGIDRDMTTLGAAFRSEIEVIRFDRFEIGVNKGRAQKPKGVRHQNRGRRRHRNQ